MICCQGLVVGAVHGFSHEEAQQISQWPRPRFSLGNGLRERLFARLPVNADAWLGAAACSRQDGSGTGNLRPFQHDGADQLAPDVRQVSGEHENAPRDWPIRADEIQCAENAACWSPSGMEIGDHLVAKSRNARVAVSHQRNTRAEDFSERSNRLLDEQSALQRLLELVTSEAPTFPANKDDGLNRFAWKHDSAAMSAW